MQDHRLYVNTIEFGGQKAVINSYSAGYVDDHGPLEASMLRQWASWNARFPNAIVLTERLSDLETMRLVALNQTPLRSLAQEIGAKSQA